MSGPEYAVCGLTTKEQRLLKVCESLMPQTLALTSELVQQYSIRGQESGVLALMEQRLLDFDLPVERVALEYAQHHLHCADVPVDYATQGSRYNLVSVLNGTSPRPHLVFNGHLDVVPAEPVARWTHPPWCAVERDGWLYGRGVGEMKSGVAAMVMAVVATREADMPLEFPLTLQAVIEGQCTGNGTLACLQQGFGGDFVMIPEPVGPVVTSAQVGVLWFRLVLDGEPAHVLDASAGCNAIEALQAMIPALKSLEGQLNAERQSPYLNVPHPFNLSIGRIEGGNWASTVPSQAWLEGRIAFPPGMAPQTMMARIERCVEQARAMIGMEISDLQVEFHGFRSGGHLVDADSPGIQILEECHHAFTGARPEYHALTCTTDLRAFHVADRISGSCYGPVAERIHGVDERVSIASIEHTLKVYALFLQRWGRLG
ncbi:acetylornithine deacetylase [Halomonas huangheensis]|nr:acetylornithine deacetylase [Halomonas huangheensis]